LDERNGNEPGGVPPEGSQQLQAAGSLDDKIACPHCGQRNPKTAGFCWHCLKSLSEPLTGTPPGAAAGTTSEAVPLHRRLLLESDAGTTEDPRHIEGQLDVSADLPFQTRARRRFTVLRIVGLIIFIAVAVVGVRQALALWNQDVTTFPSTVGDAPMLTGSAVANLQPAFEAQLSASHGGGQTDSAFYGDEGSPETVLGWVYAPGVEPETLLTAPPLQVKGGQVTRSTVGGTVYYCTQNMPVSQRWAPPDSSGGACSWVEGQHGWLMASIADPKSLPTIASGTAVGRGVETILLAGLWGLAALVAVLLALRLVREMFFR
jgi:hypothetical protein